MSKVVGSVFGGSPSQQTNVTQSAFEGLPAVARNAYTQDLVPRARALSSQTDIFTPIDFTAEEIAAQQIASDPSTISQFINPYQDIVNRDINRQFEGQFGALNQLASQAGAFGSSRYNRGLGDVERARLDAISDANRQGYDIARGQRQQEIANLSGIGESQRSLDFQRKQAPVQALQFLASQLSGIPTSGTSTSTQTGASNGLLSGLGGIGQIASGLGSGYLAFTQPELLLRR